MKITMLTSCGGYRFIRVKRWGIFKKYFNFSTNSWGNKNEFNENILDFVRDLRDFDWQTFIDLNGD